jgi:hypothetical protein
MTGRGMGAWYGSAAVRLTHEPTGATVTVNEGGPSLHRMRVAAFRMLRGKLWTMKGDQHAPPVVRTYSMPEDAHELDTGGCIDETARSYAARARSLDRSA